MKTTITRVPKLAVETLLLMVQENKEVVESYERRSGKLKDSQAKDVQLSALKLALSNIEEILTGQRDEELMQNQMEIMELTSVKL